MESRKRGCDLGPCRGKNASVQKRIAIVFSNCDLKTSLGARACVWVACVQKARRFAFAFLNPLRLSKVPVALRNSKWVPMVPVSRSDSVSGRCFCGTQTRVQQSCLERLVLFFGVARCKDYTCPPPPRRKQNCQAKSA